MVELLLANKADLTKRDKYGWQALHIVLRSNNVNRPDRYAVVKALLMNGADPPLTTLVARSTTPSMTAWAYPVFRHSCPTKATRLGQSPRAMASRTSQNYCRRLLQNQNELATAERN